jgi:hypothetical protein
MPGLEWPLPFHPVPVPARHESVTGRALPTADRSGLSFPLFAMVSSLPRAGLRGNRGLVLNNCVSCHAAACLVIRQRSPDRWAELEAPHSGAVPDLSREDRGRIFDYLKRHFNDTLPESEVPARFLEDGCPLE